MLIISILSFIFSASSSIFSSYLLSSNCIFILFPSSPLSSLSPITVPTLNLYPRQALAISLLIFLSHLLSTKIFSKSSHFSALLFLCSFFTPSFVFSLKIYSTFSITSFSILNSAPSKLHFKQSLNSFIISDKSLTSSNFCP